MFSWLERAGGTQCAAFLARAIRAAGAGGVAFVVFVSFAGAAGVGRAQEKPAAEKSAAEKATEWDTAKARGQTREIDFDRSEGTWMSVDVSPDGKWMVFDLLGHVYRMPAAGGKAECLTQDTGVALNFNPRFSPDGKTIAFVSARKGQNTLWLMDPDGK